jgi:hypothetical protein
MVSDRYEYMATITHLHHRSKSLLLSFSHQSVAWSKRSKLGSPRCGNSLLKHQELRQKSQDPEEGHQKRVDPSSRLRKHHLETEDNRYFSD